MNLGDLRRKKGFTQHDLAKMVGVRRETIARYELGERFPNKLMMQRLALVLDVDLMDIILAVYRKELKE